MIFPSKEQKKCCIWMYVYNIVSISLGEFVEFLFKEEKKVFHFMVIVISVLHQWVRHIDFVFIENIFDFHSIKRSFVVFFPFFFFQ